MALIVVTRILRTQEKLTYFPDRMRDVALHCQLDGGLSEAGLDSDSPKPWDPQGGWDVVVPDLFVEFLDGFVAWGTGTKGLLVNNAQAPRGKPVFPSGDLEIYRQHFSVSINEQNLQLISTSPWSFFVVS